MLMDFINRLACPEAVSPSWQSRVCQVKQRLMNNEVSDLDTAEGQSIRAGISLLLKPPLPYTNLMGRVYGRDPPSTSQTCRSMLPTTRRLLVPLPLNTTDVFSL